MSRPVQRTATLPHDVISGIRDLFGTINNAHRKLGLQLDVPFNTFYRAMQFQVVTPAQVEAVCSRWARWRSWYMNPSVPDNADLQLNPHDQELEPAWTNGQPKPAAKRRSAATSPPKSFGQQ
jgi:hypothetical protein